MARRTDSRRKRGNGVNGHKLHARTSGPKFTDTQAAMLPAIEGSGTGSLIIIGGREDKEGERKILREVCSRIEKRKLVVATVATAHPDEVWDEYRRLFRDLGVANVEHLHIEKRSDAFSTSMLSVLDHAGAVFFTGGDQLRITSRIGGAPVCE